MTTQTDYFHFTLARMFPGFGYAFMFVPVSQLAYSYLPQNKNNKGSSLTNLCRNWGASFGIAFVTTMLERRTQFHQSVLVSNITSADVMLRGFVNTSSRYLITRGASGPDAIHQSYAIVAKPDESAGRHARLHGLLSAPGDRRCPGSAAARFSSGASRYAKPGARRTDDPAAPKETSRINGSRRHRRMLCAAAPSKSRDLYSHR